MLGSLWLLDTDLLTQSPHRVSLSRKHSTIETRVERKRESFPL
jgi:hypothetical protein